MQNTLIVLSGDHGESLGEHGEKTHGFFIYNATLHVPFMIHLPGAHSGPAARTVSDLVNLADLMPTVLQVLKVNVPAQVQGRNLLPLMTSEEGRRSPQLVRGDISAPPAFQLERTARSRDRKLPFHRCAQARALRPGQRSGRNSESAMRRKKR